MRRHIAFLGLLLTACAEAHLDEGGAGETAVRETGVAAEPAAMQPVEEVPAELFFAPGTAPETDVDEGEVVGEPVAEVSAKISYAAPTGLLPVWNSTAGRADDALSAGAVEPTTTTLILPQHQANKTACVTPEFMTGTHNSKFPSGRRLKAPATVFASATDARNWLSSVYAALPMFLPYTHPDVKLGHGWIYNFGGTHRGQDYSRKNVPLGDDPTFVVRAIAPGKVVDAHWSNGGGNTVVVEHTAPNGMKYLSAYLHLRDGKDHDLAKARAIVCDDPDPATRCNKYKLFAQNYSNHVSWGTNAHTLFVEIGDTVQTHQAIGWAGNTGPGGAGNGLNEDGSPETARGNVHLHGYVAAKHPTEADTYILVDPYGVYNKQSTGCYDLLEDTEFDRLFAPFYENFHDLPLDVLTTYFGYYAKMGKSPKTLSVFRTLTGPKAAGSFQSGIAGSWKTRVYYSATEFQQWFDTYKAMGLVPRETSVTHTGLGEPRFSATWRPKRAGESWDHRGALSGDGWLAKWNDLVEDAGWRAESYFAWRDGLETRHAALFTSDSPRPFWLWRNRTATEIAGVINPAFAQGLAPVDLNALDTALGDRFTTILRAESGCWRWQVGMSKNEYQSLFEDMTGRGYRLHKIQGYSMGNRYLAIFRAPWKSPCP